MLAEAAKHESNQGRVLRLFCYFDSTPDILSRLSQLTSPLIREIGVVQRMRQHPKIAHRRRQWYETLNHTQRLVYSAVDQQAHAVPVKCLDQQRCVLHGLRELGCPLGS